MCKFNLRFIVGLLTFVIGVLSVYFGMVKPSPKTTVTENEKIQIANPTQQSQVNVETLITKPTSENDVPKKQLNAKKVGKGIIVEGKSIGLLNLGDTKEQAISYLGDPTEAYDYPEWVGCVYSDSHWNDYELDNRGIFIYMHDGKIFQIESFTTRFKTKSRVTSENLPNKLKKLYPNLEAYELTNSAGRVDGGANLIYWVDKAQGIAFGLYNYPRKNRREIGSVIVFNPNEEFQPQGCVSSTREFVKRPKWHLD